MKAKAILAFRDPDTGEEFAVEVGPAPEETVKKEAREEIKAYTVEGYGLVGYRIKEVFDDDG